ncbi:MAG: hypothetical protein AAF206_03255, partial [Bacteroidota bacterium]
EEFLAVKAFREDRALRDYHLLQEINQRQRPELFLKYLRKLSAQFEKEAFRDADYFRHVYKVEQLRQRFEVLHNRKDGKTRTAFDDIFEHVNTLEQRIYYAFDHWWIHEKMFLAANSINLMHREGLQLEEALVPETIDLIQDHPVYQQWPFLRLYRMLYQNIGQGETSENINQLLEALEDPGIPVEEVQRIWSMLIGNYSIRLNQSQDSNIARETVKLYRWAIETGILLVDGYVPPAVYKNIVVLSLRIKDFDAAKQNLEEYKMELAPEFRESVYPLLKGRYLFEAGRYAEVIHLLSQTHFSLPLEKVQARQYLLFSHYEQKQQDLVWLNSQIEHYIRFLRSQSRISHSQKSFYLRTAQFFKKLVNAFGEKDKVNLLKQIKQTERIDQPDWFHDKILALPGLSI